MIRIFQLISSGGYFGAENVLIQLSAEMGKSNFYEPLIGFFISEAIKHKVIESGVSGEKVHMIQNGISLNRFLPKKWPGNTWRFIGR